MRYQYGMAVGHTYMRKLNPLKRTQVPSIPADFDFKTSFSNDSDTSNAMDEDGHPHEGEYVDPPTDDSDAEG
jgi:hypothetical protein